jgi:hypothetical protein
MSFIFSEGFAFGKKVFTPRGAPRADLGRPIKGKPNMAETTKRLADSQDWRATIRGWMKLIISLTIFLVILINGAQMFYLYQRLQQKQAYSPKSSNSAAQNAKSSAAQRHGQTNPAPASANALPKFYSLIALILFNCLAVVAGMLLNFVGATWLLNKSGEPRPKNPVKNEDWKYRFASASPGLIIMLFGTILLLTTLFLTTFKIDAMA